VLVLAAACYIPARRASMVETSDQAQRLPHRYGSHQFIRDIPTFQGAKSDSDRGFGSASQENRRGEKSKRLCRVDAQIDRIVDLLVTATEA
jgi:hypothetical protein